MPEIDKISHEMSLSGKTAVITGGASGIGRAAATLFAEEGAAVSIIDINNVNGESIAESIRDSGGRAVFIHADVGSAEDCKHAVEYTKKEFGSLDILFNNAGIIRRTTVCDINEEEWDRVMAVNVKSVFLMSKYAIPVMVEVGGGVIINTSSGWGLVGGKNAVSYCASKGAVVQMTKAMAIDHGEYNIRVNCICPGDTDTPMLRSEAKQLDEPIDRFLIEAAHRPLNRIGRPEEIARAALFLASDASSFITGTTLIVDGGGLAG